MLSRSALSLVRQLSFCMLALTAARVVCGQDSYKRPAAALQDNSFFIEEAYNQEPGVVQHIGNAIYTVTRHGGGETRQMSFVFTQEWPAPNQTHQLSYTVPYSWINDAGDTANGFEDISLNYRLQVLTETETRPAFAPRLTLIVPTGDSKDGFGNDAVGYQTNLPVSKIISDRWTLHGNAGATFFPDVHGHDLFNQNLGASAIYAVTPTFNLMLEAIANWEDEISETGRKEHTFSAFVSPGFRLAFNHANKAQTVFGLAVPIGVSKNAPDFGFFFYASYEHFFYHPKEAARGR